MKKEVDIDNKLHNYLKITGIISNMIRPQVTFKKKRIKLDTTTALSTLLYSSDNWTTVAQARRITAAEIKYMRKTAGYTWTDYKYRDCKGIKYNPSSGQNTGLQKKLAATYKQNVSKITKDNKPSDQTAEETRANH